MADIVVDVLGEAAVAAAIEEVANFRDGAEDFRDSAADSAATAVAAAGALFSAWGPKAVSVPAYPNAIIKRMVLWGAKSSTRDLYVSFVQTSTSQIRVDVSDPAWGDQIGFFQVVTPDYSSGGANLPDRIPFTGLDPLSTLPSGDPDGANYTGIEGYLELNKGAVVESGAAYQPTSVAESQINPLNVHSNYSVPARVRDTRLWQYPDVIEAGPGRTYTTPRAAVEALYDGASLAALAAAPLGILFQPKSLRATPLNPVLIVIDVPDAGSPMLPWQDVNLHLPSSVSFLSRYPGAVWFEHSAGATRPIIQAHLSHQLVDINWRNSAAEGTDYGTNPLTSSARYAIHRDYLHNYQTPDPDGDYARAAMLQIIGGSLVVGPDAGIQPFGSAIPVQDTVEIMDTILDRENSYAGPYVSANNSSNTHGGGQLILRNCWDKSGRASNVSSVAVQTKVNATYPNWLDVDGCKGFTQVTLSPGTLGNFVGKWLLRGNNAMTVNSTIPGDTMGM